MFKILMAQAPSMSCWRFWWCAECMSTAAAT